MDCVRSCFRYTGMDYVYQISMLQNRKRCLTLLTLDTANPILPSHTILESIANFMTAYSTMFRQVNGLGCLDN